MKRPELLKSKLIKSKWPEEHTLITILPIKKELALYILAYKNAWCSERFPEDSAHKVVPMK
jgi:hypothetical protein